MSDSNLPELIERLQNLTLRLQDLRTEEDQVLSLALQVITTIEGNTTGPPSPRINDVVSIEDAREVDRPFRRGDRVRILNVPNRKAIGLGFYRSTTEQDRLALVTDASGERIKILTDNNEKTWRAAKNLLHI